ncbi:hypothetical protein AMTRI_Chr03g52410 [Amborella trichopoda]
MNIISIRFLKFLYSNTLILQSLAFQFHNLVVCVCVCVETHTTHQCGKRQNCLPSSVPGTFFFFFGGGAGGGCRERERESSNTWGSVVCVERESVKDTWRVKQMRFLERERVLTLAVGRGCSMYREIQTASI